MREVSWPDLAESGHSGACFLRWLSRYRSGRLDWYVEQSGCTRSNPRWTTDNDAEVIGGSAQWSKAYNRILSHLSVGMDLRRVAGIDDKDVFNSPGVFSANVVGAGT